MSAALQLLLSDVHVLHIKCREGLLVNLLYGLRACWRCPPLAGAVLPLRRLTTDAKLAMRRS